MGALTRNPVKVVACLPALAAIWYFLKQLWAPDACLDFGGSFDYVAWQCSDTVNHPYIKVPLYRFGSFWLVVVCVIFALSALAWPPSRSKLTKNSI